LNEVFSVLGIDEVRLLLVEQVVGVAALDDREHCVGF
jgi:hypothetical protein